MSQSHQATARISRSTFAWVLILIFLLLALSISIGGYFYYLSVQKVVTDRAYRQLSAVASLKVGQIDGWRRELVHDAEVIRSSSFFIEHIGGPTDPRIVRYLTTIIQQYGYRSIRLLDPKGHLILTVGANPDETDRTTVELARQAARNGKIIISDFRRIKADKVSEPDRIQLDLAAPLSVADGTAPRVTAVALIGIDPELFLYPLIQTWPGDSPTAETLLIRREGDQVVFLNELRHRQGTALDLRLPMSQTTLPAAMAAGGAEGIAEGLDYRGIKVLAAVRKIPDSPWFIVAKVDAREINAPLKASGRMVALATIFLILAAGGAVHTFWYRQKSGFARREQAAENERDALAGRYEFLSRFANDVILLSNEDGRILEANDKALTVYGYAREELLGMHLEDLWASGAPKVFSAHFETMQARDGVLLEAVHQNNHGARFWAEVRSWIIKTPDGRFHQSIIRDISDRKAAEATLRELNAQLEQRVLQRTAELNHQKELLQAANRELEAFAYSVSHDLRSPLRGIDGYSKILLEDCMDRLDEDGRLVLGQVRAAAQEMGELIDGLLEYSRLGRCELKKNGVDMTALFKDIFEEIGRADPQRRLRLDMTSLPTVQGDVLLLRALVRNLLDNAVKFTATRDPGIITVGTLNGGSQPQETTFFVRDNGAGFDMRYAGKLFGVFQRLHTQDEFQGTGVGLANVKRIVERHGGRVWAKAEPNAGAAFFFTIPGATRAGKDAS
jgi:PAS domain S-box-containing protein